PHAMPTALPLPVGGLREALDEYQRQLIEACLQRHQDNWAAAARELGLDRANLSRLARRLGLR
ncbi:helix-turn-helix domain-containing protein, partial [Pseudomonas urethralis]